MPFYEIIDTPEGDSEKSAELEHRLGAACFPEKAPEGNGLPVAYPAVRD